MTNNINQDNLQAVSRSIIQRLKGFLSKKVYQRPIINKLIIKSVLAAYQKGLYLPPLPTWLYLELGDALEKNCLLEEAITIYQKAIKIKTVNHELNRSLLRCIYNSDKSTKDILNSKIMSAIENSKAIAFIKDKILSKLDIEYENYLILYPPNQNVGDTCKHLALIKPLCIQHNKKAIVFFSGQRESAIIQANLFLDPIKPEYVASYFPIDIETEQTIRKLNSKDELCLDEIPIIPGIPRMMNNIPEQKKLTYITGDSTYQGGKAASLGIQIELNDNTIGRPIINNQSIENALNKFNNLNLSQGKSILIAPHSVTSNKQTGSNSKAVQFWQKIVNALLDKNIIPVINSRHRDSSLAYLSEMFTDEQVKFADLSLDEVIPFVELCGAFAGIRSGLCDLIAFSSKKVVKFCVQPKNSKGNYFEKLPDTRVIDHNLINDNFHIYHLSLSQPIEDEEISQIVSLFLNRIINN
jgi:tetratricopeptide (TPR) repeat protein